MKHLNKNYME
nr:unnamed protein product [Callosobruchus chinensis]